MIKNVGIFDRNLRFIGAGIIIVLGVVFQSWWGLLAIVPLATGFTRSCLLYMPFKIFTNANEGKTK